MTKAIPAHCAVDINDLDPIAHNLDTVAHYLHELAFDELNDFDEAPDRATWNGRMNRLVYFVERLEEHLAELRKLTSYGKGEAEALAGRAEA